ncbi:hypothetical protein GW796_07880 [archaeon]|nr:hypothetical protein [archaeon]
MGKYIIDGKDGKNIELNFTFDNGLPTKPIIAPDYDVGYSKEEKFYALSMYFSNEDLETLEDCNIDSIYTSKELKELWILINNHYVVFGDLDDKIIEEAENKKLVYYFFKSDETFITGIRID